MADARDFRKICLSLDGTSEAPHFDRRAFKVKRTYATLSADELTANLKFTPDEQEFKCMLAPEAFQPAFPTRGDGKAIRPSRWQTSASRSCGRPSKWLGGMLFRKNASPDAHANREACLKLYKRSYQNTRNSNAFRLV